MKTLATGWIIVHPNGRVELDYFDHANFGKEALPNTPARQREIMEDFLKTYRPNCKTIRARIVPFKEPENGEG